ncbi:hypothetical protein [Kallotenue papyrolyticum]|uniref:hypothetical protein n=1 Tax=Kallotenue papyrolyticum TaxID=1325125 RepID=UPI0004786508|nr:hypothetical protein [Kallotenue papyrolyticum]
MDSALLLRCLHSVGYDGWIALEDFSTEQPLRERLRSNLAFVQRVAAMLDTHDASGIARDGKESAMSDKPLFQNADELEARYAPDQLPPDTPEQRRAAADEPPSGESDVLIVPGAAALGEHGTPGGVAGAPGALGGVVPLPDELRQARAADDEDDETQRSFDAGLA